MINRTFIHKTLAACLALAVWSVSSMVALAAAPQSNGEITVTGTVTVDGRNAVSGSTVASGSTIVTAENSSAVVSLGKIGRVELGPNTTMALKFDNSGIYGTLNLGKVRVMNMNGFNANISTLEGLTIADATQANTFVVEKECGHTHVDTIAGLVTLRAGGNDKQVAAGTDALAGGLQQTGCKPCVRPGSVTPTPTLGLGLGALAGLLLAVGAAVGTAIVIGGSKSDVNTGGGTTVISPSR
ncbi:MAG: hypothetical protein M3209_02000 [Acidobacteriota bacterium]|nr:hypothetical protein [Acidobacteriota bacterium]